MQVSLRDTCTESIRTCSAIMSSSSSSKLPLSVPCRILSLTVKIHTNILKTCPVKIKGLKPFQCVTFTFNLISQVDLAMLGTRKN
jgi:hypothetical protein